MTMRELERVLLEEGLLTEERLEEARTLSAEGYRPLFDVLIDQGFVREEPLLRVLARMGGLEFVALRDVTVASSALRAVSPKFAMHYGVLPVKFQGSTLTIAVSNPYDMAPVEDLQTNLGLQVERVLARRGDIAAALQRHYGVGAETVERILAESPRHEDVTPVEESHDLEKLASDASVVRLVNQLLQEAIQDRATDIHFEAHRDGISIRRRIDGILYDTSVPRNIGVLYPAIVSRIKLMSGLNIVERRLPQDGRSRVTIGRQEYDLRISVVPAMHGEDIVVRILPTTMLLDLEQIGFSQRHLALLKEYLAKPHGIIFVTGPTGSGKSTTLYACLNTLNSRDRKIITIEDPVEYELRGITQTQIRPAIGLTFSHALRSMLRHDPDVMMVGEVRDRETAEIAVQTAMTGHLVFSTLHTNDAASSAVRLIDMGIDPYLIASTVLVFIAQRLVRVLCPSCREPYEREGRQVYRARGCPACNRSGFHGRVAICEFLPLAQEIQDLILCRGSAAQVREKANALGMRRLADDGWEKVLQGVTTAEEVLRVTTL
jgi:general secretion pathway protein E